MRDGFRPDRWLAWSGVLLALVVLTLLLAGVADPVPGRAAPIEGERGDLVPRSSVPFSPAVTATLYLPFVSRPELIKPNVWQGEYYNNAELSGDPVYTIEEKRIDYDWDTGAPSKLPKDGFSIRWTGEWDFEMGQYTFFVFADDGVRLWLDGKLLIDEWKLGRSLYYKTVLVKTADQHELKLEYFEESDLATIRLHWRRTDLYPLWHGDYYNQPWVELGWLYDQSDSSIQFDWGEDCPVWLPCDSFSIAWEAIPVFVTGTHRIYLYADEGYQLFVDGVKKKEGGWDVGQPGGAVDVTYDLEATDVEYRTIGFNFHDQGGPAEARLWIENLEYPEWTAEYYTNMTLDGPPRTTKHEPAIFYDWAFGKPYPILPSTDRFSARWSGQRYFHAGCYRFGLFVDDGVKLWVDGELLVSEWHDGRAEYYAPVTYLSTGYHDLVVEYYENSGEAEIRLWWE